MEILCHQHLSINYQSLLFIGIIIVIVIIIIIIIIIIIQSSVDSCFLARLELS